MQNRGSGMDKAALRNHLDGLVSLKLVNERKGKEQNQANSKGEYEINAEGLELIKGFKN